MSNNGANDMDNFTESMSGVVGWRYSKDLDLWVRGDHAVDIPPDYAND